MPTWFISALSRPPAKRNSRYRLGVCDLDVAAR
jgi:hypothetical protein